MSLSPDIMSSANDRSYEMLDHPKVGCIRGLKVTRVVQYLGVQYATLKNRFARGELIDSGPNKGPTSAKGDFIDATSYGYGDHPYEA